MDNYLNTTQIAAELDICTQHAADLCKLGRIEDAAKSTDGRWQAPAEQVLRYKRHKRVGRPPGQPAGFYNGTDLTQRRANVKRLTAEGKTAAQIAVELNVRIETVYRDRKAR